MKSFQLLIPDFQYFYVQESYVFFSRKTPSVAAVAARLHHHTTIFMGSVPTCELSCTGLEEVWQPKLSSRPIYTKPSDLGDLNH